MYDRCAAVYANSSDKENGVTRLCKLKTYYYQPRLISFNSRQITLIVKNPGASYTILSLTSVSQQPED